MESYVWLILFVLLLVFEISTLGLTTIWFAGGAFVAFWMAVADIGFWPQFIAFMSVSLVLLITTRPLATKYLIKDTAKTNVEGLIGKIVRVSEDIDNFSEAGKVQVNGIEWTARARHEGMVISKGTQVRVVEIHGVKMMVEPIGSITERHSSEKKEREE